MTDRVFASFLERQRIEGAALAEASDLVRVACLDPQHFLVHIAADGLVRGAGGTVEKASGFDVGVYFGRDHLRRVEPYELVTWFGRPDVFHPNIRPPFICLGRLTPGVSLAAVVYQVFEIVTYQRVTMREDDALNHAACVWARQHPEAIPVDRRPLKRRPLQLGIRPGKGSAA